MKRPIDPVRDLAIEIVDIFVNLLREDEIRDAFGEVYDRLRSRIKRNNFNAKPARTHRRMPAIRHRHESRPWIRPSASRRRTKC